ncbi:MAG: outer membrane lipoprotein carrier protein LolA [Sandaracinaceae bacterium]
MLTSFGALCCVLAGVLFPLSASAQAPSLERLLSRFAALPGLEAEFTEEKTMALLAVPVRSRGHIWFAGNPDRLMRRITAPDPSQALIDGGTLRMRSGGRTEELDIDSNAVLRGFVDSFRAVLAGDQASLERYYEAELTAGEGEDAWVLSLQPRNRDLRRFVRTITMRGSGVNIEEMLMVEVNGDQTRTTFRNVNARRRYSDSESSRIFRIEE